MSGANRHFFELQDIFKIDILKLHPVEGELDGLKKSFSTGTPRTPTTRHFTHRMWVLTRRHVKGRFAPK